MNRIKEVVEICFVCHRPLGVVSTDQIKPELDEVIQEYPGELPCVLPLTLEPCSHCREKGISIIEMIEEEGGEMGAPTGAAALVSEDILEIVEDPEQRNNAALSRRIFVPPRIWNRIGLPRAPKPGQIPCYNTIWDPDRTIH